MAFLLLILPLYNFSENGINDFQLIDMCQDENDEDIIWIAGGRSVVY